MTDKTDVWLPIYIGDYLKDTADLSLAEHGAFFKLLMAYWQKGCLEHCLEKCTRIAGAYTQAERDAVKSVVERFFVVDGAHLKNKRMDAEREAAQNKRKSARDKALKANAARWNNRNQSALSDAPSIHQAAHEDVLQAIPEESPSPSPSELKAKEKAKASRDALAVSDLVDMGVNERSARDWLHVRKAKRAPLTQTALDGVRREADKAGLTLDQAIVICAERGWQSFNASWLADKSGARPSRHELAGIDYHAGVNPDGTF